MRELVIKGESAEEKFAYLQIILNRILRRMNKTITGVVPPTFVCDHCKEPNNGIVFGFVAPVRGKIQLLCAVLKEPLKDNNGKVKEVSFTLSRRNRDGTITYTLKTYRAAITENISVDIFPGDIIELSTSDEIKDIYITMVYNVDYNIVQKIDIPIQTIEDILGDLDEGF